MKTHRVIALKGLLLAIGLIGAGAPPTSNAQTQPLSPGVNSTNMSPGVNSTNFFNTNILSTITNTNLTNLVTGAAQGYRVTPLVSDQSGAARFTDPRVVNSWGLLAGPGSRLIVVDNGSDVATIHNNAGRPRASITIPPPGGATNSAPTDLALNQSARSFLLTNGTRRAAATLLFVTESGAIEAWNPAVSRTNALVVVDNSALGAVYKSVAVVRTTQGSRLFAADFGRGVVETYDGGFNLLGSFTDTNLASAGFAPFGLRQIGGHLFVTFAFKSSPADTDETHGAGLGFVDEFDLAGNLVRQFAAQGTLNAPWGLALAPRRFGRFGGALLVGNFGDGTINAFNFSTGEFLGQLQDPQGAVLVIDGLWGLAFNTTGNGRLLYFASGPGDENHGLVGVLMPSRR